MRTRTATYTSRVIRGWRVRWGEKEGTLTGKVVGVDTLNEQELEDPVWWRQEFRKEVGRQMDLLAYMQNGDVPRRPPEVTVLWDSGSTELVAPRIVFLATVAVVPYLPPIIFTNPDWGFVEV